ncbi:MAG TPA: protein kinase [Rhabdochlamydiaceae bacterium]
MRKKIQVERSGSDELSNNQTREKILSAKERLLKQLSPLSGYHFDTNDFLGKGATSKVYRAVNPKGVPCAIKLFVTDNQMLFPREVSMLRKVKDVPHSQRCWDYGKINDYPSFVSDLHSSGDLFSFVFKGIITLDDISTICKQAGEYLEGLQKLKIVHGDINLQNMFYNDKTRQCVFGDMGFSFAEKETQFPRLFGVSNCRAPELLLNKMKYTGKLDIWALGCTLYEMFTGLSLYQSTCEDTDLFEDICHHFALMVAQFDMPPKDVIEGIPGAGDFFEWNELTQEHYLKYPKAVPCYNWKLMMLKRGKDYCGLNTEMMKRVHLLIDLIQRMLKYREGERILPAQIKEHPFVRDDVRFSIDMTKTPGLSRHFLRVTSPGGTKKLITASLSSRAVQCLHVPKEENYILTIFDKQRNYRSSDPVPLRDNDNIELTLDSVHKKLIVVKKQSPMEESLPPHCDTSGATHSSQKTDVA